MIIKKVNLFFCVLSLFLLFVGCESKQKKTLKIRDELFFAVESDNASRVLQILMNEHPDLIKNKKIRSILYRKAIRCGSFDIVCLLISFKCDVNEYIDESLEETILHYASKFVGIRNKYIVMLLLEEGADFMKKDRNGNLPIHYAAENGAFNIVKLYIEKGIPLSVTNKNNDTLLHSASKDITPIDTGIILIEYLIDNGISVNVKNKDGKTPLHIAAESGAMDPIIVKTLLDRGADPQLKDKAGNTALELALKKYPKVEKQWRNKKIINILKTHSGTRVE